MAGLARFVIRHRLLVIAIWIVLTIVGVASAMRLSDRWFESFSIPGFSAYETNQRTLDAFGSGEQPPLVVVVASPGKDVTQVPGVERAIDAAAGVVQGGRVGSWFDTHSDMYLSRTATRWSRRSTRRATPRSRASAPIAATRAALRRAAPPGVSVNLTGRDAIFDSQGGASGPGVLTETLIGALGALVILLFVFGTLPAIAMPLVMAAASIIRRYASSGPSRTSPTSRSSSSTSSRWSGLGVAIDYALLMTFRFREELANGRTPTTRSSETMTHAGRSVIVSGSTVAIGLSEHDHPAAALHPFDRARRHADPRRLGGRVDHAAAGAVRDARSRGSTAARDAATLRRRRPRRDRILGSVGAFVIRPPAADLPRRPRDRDARRPPGLPHQSERRADPKDRPGSGDAFAGRAAIASGRDHRRA